MAGRLVAIKAGVLMMFMPPGVCNSGAPGARIQRPAHCARFLVPASMALFFGSFVTSSFLTGIHSR